jgi:hypothetical protein
VFPWAHTFVSRRAKDLYRRIANTNFRKGSGVTRAHLFTALAFLAAMAAWLVVSGVLNLSAPVAAKGLHVVYGIQFVWSASIRRGRRTSDRAQFKSILSAVPVQNALMLRHLLPIVRLVKEAEGE